MISIRERAKNEKYFATLKYYYHNSEADIKIKIFDILLESNIYLAAHCIVTDTPNPIFLERAIIAAKQISDNFSEAEKSSKALLALAELRQFDQIITIFEKIKNPEKLHFAVLSRVFQQADQGAFLKFVETFVNSQALKSYAFTFLQYPNQLDLQTDALETLKLFVVKLYDTQAYGALAAFLDKQNLYDFLSFFFDKEPLEFCKELLESKQHRDAIFAFSIIDKFNFFRMIGIDNLINIYASSSSKKIYKYAVKIAVEYEVVNNFALDQALSKLFVSQKIKTKRRQIQSSKIITRLINSQLIEYISRSGTLQVPFLQFCFAQGIRLYSSLEKAYEEEVLQNAENYFDSKRINLVVTTILKSDGYQNSQQNVIDFWTIYFGSALPQVRAFPIEPILEKVTELYNIDYRKHFKILRNFSHIGFIQNSNEMGHYVYPSGFRSVKQLFLHNQQVKNPRAFSTRFDLRTSFRLVGYNKDNKRLNVSELELEELVANSIEWEKRES